MVALNKKQMKKLNKLKGMYALLITVATMMSICIYESCSSDEDYDYGYHFGQELSTRADGMMGMGNEGNGNSLPSVETIKTNSLVVSKMNTAWEMTINCLQENHQRIEHGFFIYYNPSNGSFDCSKICSGTPIACGQKDKTFTLPALPIKPGYVLCGVFHTHTSLRYCTQMYRITGFSGADSTAANSLKIPTLLEEYSDPVIFGGDSENLPHKLYSYNPNEE